MYQSPIEIITKKMRTQFEDNVFKAIQDYGIVVDKEELIKALQYDRAQYAKGYADGMLARKDEWISVKKNLPKESGKYIVCNAKGMVYQTKFYTYPKDQGGHWGQKDKGKGITHWMRMPEAPKGEK